MKTRVKTILVISIILICGTLIYSFVKNSKNKISVEVSEGLNLELVKIQYGFYSGSNANDYLLVQNGLKQTIFEKGESTTFETICGENDFLVTYGDQYYIKVRHFIPNNFTDGIPEPHDYQFNFKATPEGIDLILDIIGQDGLTITRKMARISQAGTNHQGKPMNKE